MKIAGLLLLVSGWLLALSALALLAAGPARNAFVGAAIAVEALGLVLLARAYLPVRAERA